MPTVRILTTSQSPLAVPFAAPPKRVLRLPPLVHRALHAALDGEPSVLSAGGVLTVPHPDSVPRHDEPTSNASSSSNNINGNGNGNGDGGEGGDGAYGALADDDITLRLHLPRGPAAALAEDIKSALAVLAETKGIARADVLLVGFRGVDYRGSADGGDADAAAADADVAAIEDVWAALPGLAPAVDGFGTLYFSRALLERVGTIRKPAANALNTPDCQRLPPAYLQYAREAGIALWAGGGGEGSDPIPSADLHNILHEFAPVLSSVSGAPKIGALIPLAPGGEAYEPASAPAVDVGWVLSYTLLSRTRNVVKDKGYIVSAEF
ncbi:hypothetical protein Q5752_001136 [Cryptotrichosporon argae]